ncbi:MAG TPA: lysylphosphatidylglycerol synthase transmembrane domain-containing protein [Hanamia sp.]|nr:lysylphosphatidylglycerol synthase transmembrane domain-containing protein [Hanamia sp.]
MKKKIFQALQYIIFLGLGIFLTWWQLGKMSPEQELLFKESLRNAHYIYLIPIIIITLLSHVSRAMRWKILIEPLGHHPSTANTFYATMCGYLANTFLPRAGEILRCTLLSRYEKIPATKLFGTILLERIFDLFCYFLLIVFTILIQLETVSDFVKTRINQITRFANGVSVWLIMSVILLFAGLCFVIIKWVFKKHHNHKLVIKIKGLHLGLKEGFLTVIHLKKRKQFIAHTVFIWAAYTLEIYIGFSALPATSSLGVGAALSVLSLATLAMIVSPGGLGAFPVAVQQVLLVYNVDNISFGWLMWGATTAIIIVAGIICFGLLIYQNRNRNEKKRYVTDEDFEPGGIGRSGHQMEA